MPIQLSELQILVMPISDLLQMVSVSTPAAASPLEENVVSPTKFKWQYPFKVCKAPQGLSLNCYFKETVDRSVYMARNNQIGSLNKMVWHRILKEINIRSYT